MQTAVAVFEVAPFDAAFAAVVAVAITVVAPGLRTDDGADGEAADNTGGYRAVARLRRRRNRANCDQQCRDRNGNDFVHGCKSSLEGVPWRMTSRGTANCSGPGLRRAFNFVCGTKRARAGLIRRTSRGVTPALRQNDKKR